MSNHSGLIAGIVILLAFLGVGYTVFSKSLTPAVSQAEFAQHLTEPGLMLAKFGAPWCGPCRQIDGQLNQLAMSHYGDVRIVLVNIDREQGLAKEYGIRSIPHLILFRDGREVDARKGYMSHAELSEWVGASQKIVYGPTNVAATSASDHSNPFVE